MEIDLEQIADKLEFLAAQIRSGKLKPSWANINYSLKFQSRPDENKDGYRMQGGQSFRDKRHAAEFMHRGLGIFQKFDGATGMLTFVFDQTEEIQKEIQALGPVPVKDWILQTHPDFTLPDFMQDIGFLPE
ncbi:hypothetical protein [Mesorhizobium sp. SP-1A]|uniref:hypothetical protein n=1 Tax=Mesorhizobium sp. SP-1A TaxID=3077840 RepID=UPI0028F73913|nr:hypothetical protein [Mesorhizobium sp. SP-1A]